jgi:hypothetical protein
MMKRVHFSVLAILLFSSAALAQLPHVIETPRSRYVKAVEIYNTDGKPREGEMAPRIAEDGSAVIDLDLGESIVKKFVIVPRTGHWLKAEKQYETSLTLMNEGPHVDLTSWKHFTSGWEKIEEPKRNEFVSVEIDLEKYDFPAVTADEIVEAVSAEVKRWGDEIDGSSWIALAKQCKSADAYPCAVSVSQVRIRISALVDGVWEPALLIRMNVPMGC